MTLSVWTDGLQSNLVAEFVGLACSIVATYLVVDRLIERNRRRHFAPLRQSLQRAVAQHLAAIAHLWAFTLGRANGMDLAGALDRDMGEMARELQRRIEPDIERLEGSADARAEFAALAQVEPDELAREIFEDITGIGEVADRVSQVVFEDIELDRMLADLAADARALDHVRSFAEYLGNVGQAEEAPMDLVLVLSLRCYRGAQDVWKYLESLDKDSGGKR
jgi:hypothetical protein